jgi:steroid delta-isomerase
MSPEEIESIVNSYLENISAMNAEGWVDNFAKDALSYDPVGEPPTLVHEGLQEFIGQLKAVFAKLEATKDSIFIAGNEAAVKWTMGGVSKTQKTVTCEGITVFEFNDAGKIQTTRAYWNPKTIIAQLRS